jgi:hypothetical protein
MLNSLILLGLRVAATTLARAEYVSLTVLNEFENSLGVNGRTAVNLGLSLAGAFDPEGSVACALTPAY